ATMVSIHSKEENEFLKTIMRRKHYQWLGGYRKQINNNIFEWKDGSKFNFSNWNAGEPDQTSHAKAMCMTVYADDVPRWFDNFCDMTRYQLCQKNLSVAEKVDVRIMEQKSNTANLMQKSNQSNVDLFKQITNLNTKIEEKTSKNFDLKKDIELEQKIRTKNQYV
ncbi:galactose-specific lectin nattectin-like protein, partial [Leptotrombidium deliense]